MQLGIRTKFIGILTIASVVPLAIAIIAVWVLGHHYYQRERGILFQAGALHLAQSIDQTVERPIAELHDWGLLSDLGVQVQKANAALPHLSDAEFNDRIQAVEQRWPNLTLHDDELQAILTNDISKLLKRFQATCPVYAEIFVTDVKGQLIGSTGKTTDYWQADEGWWQEAFQLPASHAHLEGIDFDKSAGVYSVDTAIPIYAEIDGTPRPVGVIKGVLNISMLFVNVREVLPSDRPVRQIVQDDGRILIALFGHQSAPLQEHISDAALRQLKSGQPGWMITKLTGGADELVGFAPVQFNSILSDLVVPSGMRPLYVITHEDLNTVMAPVHRQFRMLALAGALMLLTFTLVGLYIANRKIIHPIQLLRSAAQSISATAKLGASSAVNTPSPYALLDQVNKINTADELESLARDFVSMARRVLRYHVQLEEELAVKTAEIQRDLQVAREFQEALMPRDYPQIPSPNVADPLRLKFHHVYKPTSSVGGDFFDVIKLSDHRAGIFIADVMGHGARSALVTAILRTLLQDLAPQTDDPAKLLSLINQHFYGIIEQGSQFIFVSAFYMIIDTEKAIATYASAGHPSPLLADRAHHTVAPLINHLENNPALGLFSDSVYTCFTSFIKGHDVFLLFTDGIFEALNPDGEEFGRDRLRRVVELYLDGNIVHLTESVIEAVNNFRGAAPLPDDICLVAVEVNHAKPPAPRAAVATAAG